MKRKDCKHATASTGRDLLIPSYRLPNFRRVLDNGEVESYRQFLKSKDKYVVDKGDYGTLVGILGEKFAYEVCTRFRDGRVCQLRLRVVSRTLPADIGALGKLETLNLAGSEITSLPTTIGALENLEKLNLERSKITSLPATIGNLKNLRWLFLDSTMGLTTLPIEIGGLVSLRYISLYDSAIRTLPPTIGQLKNLKNLHLSHTRSLVKLPEELGNLEKLEKLNLESSKIRSLPAAIGNLKNLGWLNLNYTMSLTALPNEVGGLINLRRVFLTYSAMERSPEAYLLRRILPFNTARHRIEMTWKEPTHVMEKLWPLLLGNAKATVVEQGYGHGFGHGIPTPDVVYLILAEGRESFLGVIMARTTGAAGIK